MDQERKDTLLVTPRQCAAMRVTDPTSRCSRPAMPGSEFCHNHRRKQISPNVKKGFTTYYRIGTFTDVVDAAAALPDEEVKDLTGEISLLRATLTRGLEELRDAGGMTSVGAAPFIQSMTDAIGKLVTRMDTVQSGYRFTLNIKQVTAMAEQIVHIINQEVPDPLVRQRISERLRNLVVVGQ